MIGVPFVVLLCIIGAVSGHYLFRWIGDGGICETVYGEALHCISPDNCYSKYTVSDSRLEICGFDGPVTIMCCTNYYSQEWQDEESLFGDGNFPYPLPIQNQSNPDTDPSEKEKEQEPQNDNSDQEDKAFAQRCMMGQNNENVPAVNMMVHGALNLTHDFSVYPPTLTNSTSLIKCREYHPLAVYGGSDARPRQYPHMALLGYGNENDIQWLCGGSLISDRYVLTAAHCLCTRDFGFVAFVRLGELNLTDPSGVTFKVETIISHPSYKRPARYHDIALLKLNETVNFALNINPICLPTVWDVSNFPLNVTGWGRTDYNKNPASVLQTARLPYVPYERCRNIYRTSREVPTGIIETLQLCAGGGPKMEDTCPGDSGGPLQFMNFLPFIGTFPEIAGITSFGKKCTLTAGVYTRILPYVPWIESIVWPNE